MRRRWGGHIHIRLTPEYRRGSPAIRVAAQIGTLIVCLPSVKSLFKERLTILFAAIIHY
jgi:hypothetical protein